MSKINSSKSVKIIVLITIGIIISGIWVVKNNQNKADLAAKDNSDFSLHVTEAFDMDKLKSYGKAYAGNRLVVVFNSGCTYVINGTSNMGDF